MIHTKPIDEVSYQDVVDFCNEGHREAIHLDYKREIDRSITKTIAAMANTWGGVIIVGVDDKDSAPQLPVMGMPYKQHLREQINNLILGNITPPVFPEIQVCRSPNDQNAFVVVRVPQSQLTPHAIRGNTQVYLRTDTSNEPEDLATVDRVQWLIERRKKSEELKNGFLLRSGARFDRLCERSGAQLKHADMTLSIGPLFPFEMLRSPKQLREEVLQKIRVDAWGMSFPKLIHYVTFEAAQESTYGFFYNTDNGYICYEELNQWGFFTHREDLAHTEHKDGKEVHSAVLHSVMTRLDIYLDSMARLYAELGFWGILEFRLRLAKLDQVSFVDLPAPRGSYKIENHIGRPVDSTVEIQRMFSCVVLAENRVQLAVELLTEAVWALGFHHIKPESIRTLMHEAGRG